jgi:hypothetical protein
MLKCTRVWLRSWLATGLVVAGIAAPTCSFVGCERKEKVLDVKTPAGDVEVERNKDTGEVRVEVRENNQ